MGGSVLANWIVDYCNANPGLEIQDVFKFLYQSCLGCEHLVTDYERVVAGIKTELSRAAMDYLPDLEMLGEGFFRYHLKKLQEGLSAETLGRLFVLSSRMEAPGISFLERNLKDMYSLAKRKFIPFPADEVQKKILWWKDNDLRPCHHSEKFNSVFHPAYRVLSSSFLKILPLLTLIDKECLDGSPVFLSVSSYFSDELMRLMSVLIDVYAERMNISDLVSGSSAHSEVCISAPVAAGPGPEMIGVDKTGTRINVVITYNDIEITR